MAYHPDLPLIVQSDRTVLLEVDHPLFEEARDCLAAFAELEKSPEHVHTYRITPLSLWNAAAAGLTAEKITSGLEQYSKYPLPDNLRRDIADYVSRYGRLKLVQGEGLPSPGLAPGADQAFGQTQATGLFLVSEDPALLAEVWHHKHIRPFLRQQVNEQCIAVEPAARGLLKQALIHIGYPAEDLAGYTDGAALRIALRESTASGLPFVVRNYQRLAAEAFWAGGSARGGSGVIVLPCGAGKTIVGLAVMALVQAHTLIITTGITAVHQWIREMLDKTDLSPGVIGEYTGEQKDIRPVTVTTYQTLTYRPRKEEDFPHMALFQQRDWGLVIYDEVHLLPAPVFRATAEIQARRRLGLTATLVREDHREDDVFTLIGPKKFDVPWKDLERQGWIAPAACHEIRVPLDDALRMEYAVAEPRDKFRLASENPAKLPVLDRLVERHRGDHVLVIGQFIRQLKVIAARLQAPLLTGKTAQRERENLYEAFRRGEIPVLVVSRVANFSVDLPEANVAIQVSGTFGSRQEEAQRLGRILRPKQDGGIAHFYTLVTAETSEQSFAANRQLFLTEQGYRYLILRAEEVGKEEVGAGEVGSGDTVASRGRPQAPAAASGLRGDASTSNGDKVPPRGKIIPFPRRIP